MNTTPRYIDGDAFYEHIQNKMQTEFVPFVTLLNEIKEFPTEDVAPVIHTHWEKTYWQRGNQFEYRCANCKRNRIWKKKTQKLPNFCDRCGAKMDEKEG